MNVVPAIVGAAAGTAAFALLAHDRLSMRRPTAADGPLLAATLTSAVADELVWRGCVQRAAEALLPRPAAVAATTTAFAAAHAPRRPNAWRPYLVLGAAFGALACGGRRLTSAVAAHAAYDVLALLAEEVEPRSSR